MPLFDKNLLFGNFKESGVYLEIFEEVASTNDKAFELLSKGNLCAAIAETQTSGRGRLGRKWEGSLGESLFFSGGFVVGENTKLLSVPCCVAILLCRQLKSAFGANLQIKWPNDIYFNNKKLCGILCEAKAENGKISKAVVGIGVNIMPPKHPESFRRPPVSLSEICKNADINECAICCKNAFVQAVNCRNAKNVLSHFAEYDWLYGKKVKILLSQEEIEGIACGINENAELLIKQANGEIKNVSSGEASIAV